MKLFNLDERKRKQAVTIEDWLEGLTQGWFGHPERIPENLAQPKFFMRGNQATIRQAQLAQYDAFFSGDASELLSVYSSLALLGFNKNPVYERNSKEFFWSLSSEEEGFKRTHSGFPRDMVLAMCDRIGAPRISSKDKKISEKLVKIADEKQLSTKISKSWLPLTLVEGLGVLKPVFDPDLSKEAFLVFYKERDVHLINRNGHLVGIAFFDYYEDSNDFYTLVEVRHIAKSDTNPSQMDSVIEYHLFKGMGPVQTSYTAENQPIGERVPLWTLPQTAHLEPIVYQGFDRILAVPMVFYPDHDRFGYGVSIYSNKLSIFDDLDQAYTMQSRTTRLSTPVEYLNAEYLDHDENGQVKMPNTYARSYVKLSQGFLDGNGAYTGASMPVTATQPDLKVEQYGEEIERLKIEAIGSFISAATMGIGVGKKENQGSQREKEKQTILTRNNIVKTLMATLSEAITDCFVMTSWGNGFKDPNIEITFNDFSNPTPETKANILTPMLTQNAISPTLFVEEFWGDSLTEEQKKAEIEYIKERQARKDEVVLKNDIKAGRLKMSNVDKVGGPQEEVREAKQNGDDPFANRKNPPRVVQNSKPE